MNFVESKTWFLQLGAIHKLRHTNFMIFSPPPLVTGGHISETPPPLIVTSHILQFYTKKLLNYELARHRIELSEH